MAFTKTKARLVGLTIAAFVVLLAFIVNLASASGSPNWYNNGRAYPAAFARAAGSAASEALVSGTGQLWCQSQLGDFAGGRDQDDFGVNLKSPSDPYSAAGTEWINGCAAGFLRVSGSSPTDEQSASAPAQSSEWSAARSINSDNSLASISCSASSFCMAVDSGGNVYTYSGGSWSAGQQIDSGDSGLTSISCPSRSFCAATDSGAGAYIYSNGRWSGSSLVGAGGNNATLTSVSCPTNGFCIATGLEDAYTYSGGAWSAGQTVQDNIASPLKSISCSASSFCMAVDSGGNVYTFRRD